MSQILKYIHFENERLRNTAYRSIYQYLSDQFIYISEIQLYFTAILILNTKPMF